MKSRRTQLLVALFAAAVALRIAWLGRVPCGIENDEATVGYATWSLLLHPAQGPGAVFWGDPLMARTSAASPLYAVLSLPFIAALGLSVTATRLPAAIAGILSLWGMFRLGRRSDDGMAELPLLLAATSPWQLMASRWAGGANVAPAFVLLAVVLFEHPSRRTAKIGFGALALGLAGLGSGPAALFALAFSVCALVILRSSGALSRSLGAAVIVAPPLLLFTAVLGAFRAGVPPISSGAIFYDPSSLLPFKGGLLRLPENAGRVIALLVGATRDGSTFSAAGYAPQQVLLMPFLVWGMLHAAKPRGSVTDRLMLAWFLCALGTAMGFAASVRNMSLVWLPALWLSARGLWLLREYRPLSLALRGIVLACGAVFAIGYFAEMGSKEYQSPWVGFGEAMAHALSVAPPGAPVIVTNHTPNAYLPTLFFSRVTPERLASTVKIAMFPPPGPVLPGTRTGFAEGGHLDVVAFDRFLFGSGPAQIGRAGNGLAYWVAERSELSSFDTDSVEAETFGRYAVIGMRPAEETRCLSSVDPRSLSGAQDFGALTVDGSVMAPGTGFTVMGQRFAHGIGVHGDSHYELRLPKSFRKLSFGVALVDSAGCGDGVSFEVLADGQSVFASPRLRAGDVEFRSVSIAGARVITFITRAGVTNSCDHAAWLRPILVGCGS